VIDQKTGDRSPPWLNVGENVAFGLDKRNRKEKNCIVDEYLKLVGLNGFESADPSQLSGGVALRVAIAHLTGPLPILCR